MVENLKIGRPSALEIIHSTICHGDALESLRLLPDNFAQCAITSPPYWGLRDYGNDKQIGLEPTLEQYINSLVQVFRELRRVLKDDGVFWLNIGDSYTSGNRKWRAPDKKNPARAMSVRPDTPEGLKPKDLIGVPWRVALALQQDGWYLRSDIIWNKPNAMPESVKDRPTRSHEYLFMLTKSEKYRYNREAVLEETSTGKRNRRSVWSVKTRPFPQAHFATFPEELIRPCVLSSSDKSDFVIDPFFGAGTVGVVAKKENRLFFGVEINKKYVEMAAARLETEGSVLIPSAA